jgi:hypothetical protein
MYDNCRSRAKFVDDLGLQGRITRGVEGRAGPHGC